MEQDCKEQRAIFIQNCMELNQEYETLTPEIRIKLLKLYNCHFTNSNNWDFQSTIFKQLVRSYNVNLKVIFDLPYACHNFLGEELSGRRQALVLIYSKNIQCKQASLRSLLRFVKDDVRSGTGGNLKKILLDTKVLVVPGQTHKFELRNFRVYDTQQVTSGSFLCLCPSSRSAMTTGNFSTMTRTTAWSHLTKTTLPTWFMMSAQTKIFKCF